MAFVAPSPYFNIARLGTASIRTLHPRFITPARRQAVTLSLTSNPHREIKTSSNPATMSFMQADLDHIALDCKGSPLDVVDFYVSVLNFQPYRVDAFKAGKVPFPSVRASPNTILDFFQAKDEGMPPPKGLRQSNHFCFAVSKEDWDLLRERLSEKNVETMGDPKRRSGARGDGTSIYFKDPEGNVLEFRYYDEDAKPDED